MRIILVSSVLLLIGCAQPVPPTGGPIDTHPPVEIQANTSPQNYSVNFNSSKIEIPFDEYITLKNKEQIVVSPRMESKPNIYLKGKKIIIELKSPLEPNTTYSINFGNSIQDITNANVLANYRYVFSTGTYLDSLEYVGYVYNAFTSQPKENITVMLYNEPDDSSLWNKKPTYFMKTDKSGRFHLKNLKEGTYQVIALEDKNNNYKYDATENQLAFKSDLLTLLADTANQPGEDKLFLFTDKPEKQYVEAYRYEHPGKIAVKLNQKPVAPTVEFKNPNQHGEVYSNNPKDSIFIYLSELYTDSVSFYLSDTALKTSLSFLPPSHSIRPFNPNFLSNLPGKKLNPNESLKLSFNRPINSFNTDSIVLLGNEKPVPFQSTIVESDKRILKIEAKWTADIDYALVLKNAAVKDIYDFVSDTAKLYFNLAKDEVYGSVSLKIGSLNSQKSYLLWLKRGDDLIYSDYIKNVSAYTNSLKGLSPAKYDLLLIEDTDENGAWTTGNYLLKQQPEPIYRWEGGIQLKANWLQDIEWEPIKVPR